MPSTKTLFLGLCSTLIASQVRRSVLTNSRHRVPWQRGPSSKPSSAFHSKMAELSTSGGDVFVGKVDRHRGVHVRSSEEPCEPAALPAKVERSLAEWQRLNLNAAWFLVSLEHSDWVPALARSGFCFHHAKPRSLAMVRWLAPEPSRVPAYAHTLVGAGAVVVNAKRELLVVQERYADRPYYKLPGGYVEPGEYVPDAAVREVLEETGVRTEFKCLLGFRHAHSAPFGCSDMYFVVELEPKSSEITRCETEIEDSLWMPVDEYLEHPQVHENNRLFLRKYLFAKEKGLAFEGTRTFHPVTDAPQMLFALGPVQ